jgi:ATP-dependent protease ClpP protease subunit
MTGEDAKAYGVIDHVITDRDDLDKLEAVEA